MVVVLAEDVMNQLMLDVKYDELQGIKIGEAMEAELAAVKASDQFQTQVADPGPRISQSVITVGIACPQCNAPVLQGALKCSNCGIELQWSHPVAEMNPQAIA